MASLTDSLRGLFTLFVLSDVALAVTGLAPSASGSDDFAASHAARSTGLPAVPLHAEP